MLHNAQLRRYLIRCFLVTLVFIGLAQLVVGGIINAIISPLVAHTLGVNEVMSASDIRATYTMIFEILLIFLVQRMPLGSLTDSFLGTLFGDTLVQNVGELSRRLAGGQVSVYILQALGLLILTILIWILPYIIGAIFFSRIVTHKVHELEEKQRAKDREIEKQRNLMLSDMAHDIKTPITTIAGFARALADDEVPADSRPQYLNAIYAKSMQISDLITLLFDYVKLDSAGYKLHPVNTDICELTRQCISTLYTDFEEKGLELDIDIPDEPIHLNLDPTQMQRAISNILTNDIRHNPTGTCVYIKLTQDPDSKLVKLQFSDNGTPIERETAIHLFEPFVQGDATRSSKSGSGLGLSITKKIVEMHGGKILLYQFRSPGKHAGHIKMFEIRLK